MRRVRVLHAALLALLLACVAASSAQAAQEDLQRVAGQYRAAGLVDGCGTTPARLRAALGEVTPALEQYAPGLRAAIESALDARTSGACSRAVQAARRAEEGATAPPAATTTVQEPADPGPGQSTPPVTLPTPQPAPLRIAPVQAADGAVARAQARRSSNAGVPLAVWVLAVLLALWAVGALVVRALGASAEEGGRVDRSRHAGGEAAFRAAGAWADFRDWLRLGR